MYYPYLHGKQFELLAMREFAKQSPKNGNIVPIIEPVKLSVAGLSIACRELFEQNLKFALVLNPTEGEFRKDTRDILPELPILTDSPDKWIPAFLCQENLEHLSEIIRRYDLRQTMVIFKDSIEIDDELLGFLSNLSVQYIVNSDPDPRHTPNKLRSLENQSIIRLDDRFKNRPRNADYLNVPEERFTEEHRYYREDGYAGFSDYTALPKDFSDGGMLPYAVAIHLTYKKNEEKIYVRHFVSDTNDDQSNVHRKFFEAATKAKDFFRDREKTPAVEELIQLLDDEKYPGLGPIKKISIRNHIELMNQILSE